MSEQINHDEQPKEPKTEFKFISAPRQAEIVEKAVAAILDNFSKVDAATDKVGKIEGGQLGVLATALKDIPEPVTEEIWDEFMKANVSDLLANATANGKTRYANSNSRDVMVGHFKAATIGLTLAKQDPAYQPTSANSKNLKKYADYVRPMLQAAIDPATGKPRHKSIETKPRGPRKLSGDTYYWLVGRVGGDDGGTILARQQVFGELTRELDEKRLEGKFQSFFYLTAKMEPLVLEGDEMVIPPRVTSPTFDPA